MNKKKKWLSLLLSLALLFSLCPQTVSAEEISSGQTEETCPFTVTSGEYGTDYEWDETTKKLTIKTSDALTISMKDSATTPVTAQIIANKTGSSGSYTWTSLNLTLAGVNITAPANASAPLFTGGSLAITLEDGTINTLTGEAASSYSVSYGIYASDNLTINGPGTLNATGGAITTSSSGNNNRSCGIECYGTISINGGTIHATGGNVSNGSSYGIRAYDEDYKAINITGGTVTATGGNVSASGNATSAGICGAPTISGGVVNATGGTVTVSGSEAIARSYGIRADTGSITISGGSGTAKTTATSATVKQAMDKEPTLSNVITTGAYNSTEMSWVPIVQVTGVSLTPTTLTLPANGATATLTATVEPTNATDANVTWSSSDDTIATVNNGEVTALKAGTATITASAGGQSATCTVTVTDPVAAYGVSLDKTTLALTVGGTQQLTATVAPDNATNKAVSWSSSNESVATVSNGLVTAVSAGKATITVTTADGPHTATCTVTVTAPTQYTVTYDGNKNTGGSVATDSTSYASGATVTVLGNTGSLAKTGYTFAGWNTKADGSGTTYAVNAAFTITGNTTLYAQWTKNSSGSSTGSGSTGGGAAATYYTITATAGTGGSISPTGSVSVREDLDKTFTITPDKGYVIANVIVDGKSVGAVKSYTFEDVSKKHTIKATFAPADEQRNPQTGVDMDFEDVSETDWFYESVAYVFDEGLMNGTSATTFSPYLDTTRGMIVTILHRLAGSDAPKDVAPFLDVTSDQYYATAVAWAYENGIVNGYSAEAFGPNDAITREQMAAILMNYAKFMGYDTTAAADLSKFSDADKISGYAVPSMAWANASGLINGKGDSILDPTGNAQRCEVAAILHRFCETIVK